MNLKIAVILPAAGLGRRFDEARGEAAAVSKIELDLHGKPVFLRAVELFLNRPVVGAILLAVNPDTLDEFRFRWGDKLSFHGVTLVPGGRAERWETVLKALDAVPDDCTHAAIHDAARPLASSKLIDRVFDAASRFPAVIPGVPVSATLKRVVAEQLPADEADPLDAILGPVAKPAASLKRVAGTVDRTDLIEVQTPQVFELSLLRRAYDQITTGKLTGKGITDDAGLVESLGEPVRVVEGEATNLKITRPDDLKLAQAFTASFEKKDAALLARKRLFKDEDDE